MSLKPLIRRANALAAELSELRQDVIRLEAERDEARAETRRVRKRLHDENRKAVARTKAQRARADGYGEALERIAKAHATAAHLQSIARTALNETYRCPKCGTRPLTPDEERTGILNADQEQERG